MDRERSQTIGLLKSITKYHEKTMFFLTQALHEIGFYCTSTFYRNKEIDKTVENIVWSNHYTGENELLSLICETLRNRIEYVHTAKRFLARRPLNESCKFCSLDLALIKWKKTWRDIKETNLCHSLAGGILAIRTYLALIYKKYMIRNLLLLGWSFSESSYLYLLPRDLLKLILIKAKLYSNDLLVFNP
jgi:hypothetical protein